VVRLERFQTFSNRESGQIREVSNILAIEKVVRLERFQTFSNRESGQIREVSSVLGVQLRRVLLYNT